jgi:phage shock protein PspC (stress-responsive transcriptional regulator)
MRNRKLGGVCAGFARYLDWDVTLIRIAFILTTVFYGTGLLVYIVCWLAMPKDDWSIPQHSPAAPPAS